MYKFKEDSMRVPLFVWSGKGSIEQNTIDQMKNVCSLPFAFHHAALMPDGHLGYGAAIGAVVALKDVVCPSIVGVDIGCGMCAVKTSLTEINTEFLEKIMAKIRQVVPVGFNKHKEPQNFIFMPSDPCTTGTITNGSGGKPQERWFPVIWREYEKALTSLGTLGGGNHFIEIQKGNDGHVWIMLHSGSRNLGKQVADHYNNIAVELNKKWFSSVPIKHELAFLPFGTRDELAEQYQGEMNYCVEYALKNRKLMMDRILDIFFIDFFKNHQPIDSPINIAHNYAALENHFGQNVWVHRKGATLAREGTIGIIPGSQGTKSYIVKGLGNRDSFMSCSHGAGRTMGRKQAKKELDLDTVVRNLDAKGIFHSVRGIDSLDEAPEAYKDITKVMNNQSDLVEVLVELSPLACIKG